MEPGSAWNASDKTWSLARPCPRGAKPEPGSEQTRLSENVEPGTLSDPQFMRGRVAKPRPHCILLINLWIYGRPNNNTNSLNIIRSSIHSGAEPSGNALLFCSLAPGESRYRNEGRSPGVSHLNKGRHFFKSSLCSPRTTEH